MQTRILTFESWCEDEMGKCVKLLSQHVAQSGQRVIAVIIAYGYMKGSLFPLNS